VIYAAICAECSDDGQVLRVGRTFADRIEGSYQA
jgi:hypothetical protein